MGFRLIWDDGTPSCLPRWARDEIANRRLRQDELLDQLHFAKMRAATRYGAAGPCFECGEEVDPNRGWLREHQDAPATYWVCSACLDRLPTFIWDDDGKPRVIAFGGVSVGDR